MDLAAPGSKMGRLCAVTLMSRSHILLLLDGDDAGQRATDQLGEVLRRAIRVRVGINPRLSAERPAGRRRLLWRHPVWSKNQATRE